MYLICYDITKNSLRTKMGKLIIDAGFDRINKSVYLGPVSDSSLTTLENQLLSLMQKKGQPTDSLIVLPLTLPVVKQMRIYGQNGLDKEELTGEKSTLIM